jgi:hypothetical protein
MQAMLATIFIPLAFWLTAAIAGAMLFFGAVIAPLIFKTLAEEDARRLTRAIFPRYYLVLAVASGLAAVCAGVGGRLDGAVVIAVVGAGFIYARESMTPRINALKDRALAGDEAAEADFDRTHRMSVTLNMVQLLAFLAIGYGLVRGF